MNCPKCNTKTRIIDARFNMKENEMRRRRLCTNRNCSHKFYTTEFYVDSDEKFKKEWDSSPRSNSSLRGRI